MPNNIGISAINIRTEIKPDKLRVSKPSVDITQNQKKIIFNPPEKLLFNASDGKTYDLKSFARELLCQYVLKLTNSSEKDSILEKSYKFVSNLFRDNTTENELFCLIKELHETIDNADNIENLFEDLTGKQYSKENLEKFLKQEINLKIYKNYQQLTNKTEPKCTAMPVLDSTYYSKPIKNISLQKQEENLFNNISKNLDAEYKQKLSNLLKQGILTESKAENNTTILENLNKIVSTPRYQGLDRINILKECIDILENPSIITQFGEDIPEEYQNEYIEKIYRTNKTQIIAEWKEYQIRSEAINSNDKTNSNPTEKDLKEFIKEKLIQRNIGTCAAASIEYDLATKYTAEFFRMVEAFTSKSPQTTKKIPITIPQDFFGQRMSSFNTKFKVIDNNTAQIDIQPDTEALKLAQIQNNHKDKNERSMIDILMQSMIMNVGSGGTYNSLLDKREKGNFSNNEGGLVDIEVQFTKETLTGVPVFNEHYQEFDGKKYKFSKSQNYIKKEIENALEKGENVVIGYIFKVEDGNYSGHEITIVGQTKNINGEALFICQDSDATISAPITISEDFILSNIHHASFADKDYSKYNKYIQELAMNNTHSQLITQPAASQTFVTGKDIITPWSKQQNTLPINTSPMQTINPQLMAAPAIPIVNPFNIKPQF